MLGLVVVFVPAHYEVHAVGVERRDELFVDAPVRAAEPIHVEMTTWCVTATTQSMSRSAGVAFSCVSNTPATRRRSSRARMSCRRAGSTRRRC